MPVLLQEVPEDFPGFLVFPVSPLLQRPVKSDGIFGAIVNADAAVPALVRMQDDRGLAFFRVGDQDVDLAVINAGVAAFAFFSIEKYRVPGADDIW